MSDRDVLIDKLVRAGRVLERYRFYKEPDEVAGMTVGDARAIIERAKLDGIPAALATKI